MNSSSLKVVTIRTVAGLPRGVKIFKDRQPVQLRHADVHEEDVGLKPGGQLDAAAAVLRLAHVLQPRVAAQDRAQPGADQGFTVDNEHPNGKGSRPRSSSVPLQGIEMLC